MENSSDSCLLQGHCAHGALTYILLILALFCWGNLDLSLRACPGCANQILAYIGCSEIDQSLGRILTMRHMEFLEILFLALTLVSLEQFVLKIFENTS